MHNINTDIPNHFLPLIQRLRYVKINSDNMLEYSCNLYKQYGYPCHHMFHVLNCQSISDIKKEWIRIRWTKEYIVYHYEPDTPLEKKIQYQFLYDNHTIGIYMVNQKDAQYSIYKGFNDRIVDDFLFQIPNYQFLCQVPTVLCIEKKTEQTIKILTVY